MIGETIGNFKVVSRLGRGGMGEVFLGEHTGIQTKVAIKVLHEEISRDTEHVDRFFNEAKIVGRIKHAGIVKIFDSGFFKGHAYLVLELLEGESLAERLETKGPMSAGRLAEVGRQISSVLDATHRAGITHRDLKPDNIFLVTDEELVSRERVKVLDFGIAKLHGTLASGSPRTVGTMGTPAYMAPEQWGDSGNVDWRADVYSLGCVLFEMACGRPPFDVKTIADACTKHLQVIPPRVRSVREDLPASLDALIARMLEKRPEARCESMAQITAELEALATIKRARTDPDAMKRDAWSPTIVPDSNPKPTPVPPRKTAVLPPKSQTTLGGSLGQISGIDLQATRGRRGRMVAISAGLVAALATVTIAVVAARGTSGTTGAERTPVPTSASTPVPTSAPMPTTATVVNPPTPTPTPAVVAPPPAVVAPPPAVVAPPPAVVAPPPIAAHPNVRTPNPKPQPNPKPDPTPKPQPNPNPNPNLPPTPNPQLKPDPKPEPVTPPTLPAKPARGSGSELDDRT